jgi:uncharacterized membrane protein
MARSGRRFAIAAAFAAAVLWCGLDADVVRVRYALAGAAVLFSLSLFTVGRRRGIAASSRRADLTLPLVVFAGGVMLDAVAASFLPELSRSQAVFQFCSDLSVWMMVWTLYFLALSQDLFGMTGDARITRWQDHQVPRAATLGLIVFVVSLAVLGTAHWLTHRRAPVIADEMLYVLQARLFGQPGFSRALSAPLYPFFMSMQAVYRDGRLFTQYPPGWPAILAVFDQFGAIDWAGATLGSTAVLLTFLLGRRLYSSSVGLLAAMLFLFHPLVIETENNYWSHAGSTVCLLIAAYVAFGDVPGKRWQMARWQLVGLSIGMACAIRPLTGVTAGSSLAAWYCIRERRPAHEIARIGLHALTGMLIPAVGVGYYNHQTLGHFLAFGYSAGNGSLQQLGFGVRGLIYYDHRGMANAVTFNFTPRLAIGQLARRIWEIMLYLLPSALFVPLLVLLQRYRFPWRWAVVGVFLVLPAGYAFWYFDVVRFYVDIFPFLFIGVARLLEYLAQRRPRVAAALVAYLLIAAPVRAAAAVQTERGRFRKCRDSDAALEALGQRTAALVFVANDTTNDGSADPLLFSCLYHFNTREFPGNIVVARDTGAGDSTLVRLMPRRDVVRLRWDGPAARALIEPVAP